MNGPPVSPWQKSENAPTWRPRCHEFWTLFWPNFRAVFGTGNAGEQEQIIPNLYVNLFLLSFFFSNNHH